MPLKVRERRIAERKSQEIERQLELGNDLTHLDKARRRPIAEHLHDFEQSPRSRGVGDRDLENLLPRIRKTIDGCGLRTLADPDTEKIEAWLGRQHRLDLLWTQPGNDQGVACLQLPEQEIAPSHRPGKTAPPLSLGTVAAGVIGGESTRLNGERHEKGHCNAQGFHYMDCPSGYGSRFGPDAQRE
jgi:hypothetical protein